MEFARSTSTLKQMAKNYMTLLNTTNVNKDLLSAQWKTHVAHGGTRAILNTFAMHVIRSKTFVFQKFFATILSAVRDSG
jgi:hypothetical protein